MKNAYGVDGLFSTKKVLTQNNIAYLGVGENTAAARKSYIIEKEGLRIGIYGCCEHEFSCATDTTTGANPFDPIDSFDDVCHLSDAVDYVIENVLGSLHACSEAMSGSAERNGWTAADCAEILSMAEQMLQASSAPGTCRYTPGSGRSSGRSAPDGGPG